MSVFLLHTRAEGVSSPVSLITREFYEVGHLKILFSAFSFSIIGLTHTRVGLKRFSLVAIYSTAERRKEEAERPSSSG